jgi:N6-adenosine-specific RNA methylase IME4
VCGGRSRLASAKLHAEYARGGGRASQRAGKGRKRHYTDHAASEQILELPPPLTQPRAHLWLWCLSQHIDWGYLLARAWGFEPQIAVTWAKPGLGMGRFQSNTEHLLGMSEGWT